jgi:superfamily II DNA/RNA helicase
MPSPRSVRAHAHSARSHPALLAGRDLIGQAGMGTGKTAARAPLIGRPPREPSLAAHPRAGLVPTRELATQGASYHNMRGPLTVVPRTAAR